MQGFYGAFRDMERQGKKEGGHTAVVSCTLQRRQQGVNFWDLRTCVCVCVCVCVKSAGEGIGWWGSSAMDDLLLLDYVCVS